MKNPIHLVLVGIISLSLLGGAWIQPAHAASLVIVTNTNDSGAGSLRQAVAEVFSGGLIRFDPSLAGQTITLQTQISITKPITIDGAELEPRVEISGDLIGDPPATDFPNRIFYIDTASTASPVTINNVVMKNGLETGLQYYGYGGAIFVGSDTALNMDHVRITNNKAYKAGAVYISPYAIVTITNSEINNNQSEAEAGAFYIQSIGKLHLRTSTLSGNYATYSGGVMYFSGSTQVSYIEGNWFDNNTASSGGVIVGQLGNARMEIRNNLFTGNQAVSTGGAGGAIHLSASTVPTVVVLENNTFYNNAAGFTGGAAILDLGVTYYLVNNTFSGNKVLRQDGRGGNLSIGPGVSIQRMNNNIIANSAGGADCFAYFNSYLVSANNIIEDASPDCVGRMTQPPLTGDPALLPLANNGGPTQTMALGPGSIALDAGINDSGIIDNCTSTDQRGVVRPQGAACDIGAYEQDTTSPAVQINQAAGQEDPAALAPVHFTAVFSEPIRLSSFAGTDVLLGGTAGATTAVITEVAPMDRTTFDVAVSGMVRNGTVTASIPMGRVKDIAGNTNTASTSVDNIVDFVPDPIPPYILSILRAGPEYTSAQSVDFTVTFSEPVKGVDVSDFLPYTTGLAGAQVSAVNGAGDTYTVSVLTGSGNGTLRLDVPVGALIRDLAGNLLTGLPYVAGEPYQVSKNLLAPAIASQDGWILESKEEGEAGGRINPDATVFIAGDNAGDKQYRSILSFDTSGLPDGAIITSARLEIKRQSLVGTSPFSTHGALKIDITQPYFGSLPALQRADFQFTTDTTFVGVFSTAPFAERWYSASLGAAAFPAIDPNGVTQLRLRFNLGDNDDGSADYLKFFSGNAAAADQPVLIIDYYVP